MVLDIDLSVGLIVLDCRSVRDMSVSFVGSIDQRDDQRHAENAMLRVRVQSTASRSWTT